MGFILVNLLGWSGGRRPAVDPLFIPRRLPSRRAEELRFSTGSFLREGAVQSETEAPRRAVAGGSPGSPGNGKRPGHSAEARSLRLLPDPELIDQRLVTVPVHRLEVVEQPAP